MPISPYLKSVRDKVGHDLLTLTAASVSIFDNSGRLLLAEDAETGLWTLPGGAIDPNEIPSDAAVRECFEETGLSVELIRLVGIFGGPDFLVTYPNADVTYYTVIAFEARIVGGSHRPDRQEIASLRYVSRSEWEKMEISPSSRIISRRAFERDDVPYFAPAEWSPGRS